MGSVEAAASLFGSSDSGSDLDFLTAPESTNTSAAESPAGPGANASKELFPAQDTSNLFGGPEDAGAASSLFDAQGEAGPLTGAHDTNGTHNEHGAAYQPENPYGYGQEAQTVSTYAEEEYHNYDEGWYDEQGKWHAYEDQGVVANTGNNASQTPTDLYVNSTADDSYNGHDGGVGYSNTSSTYSYNPTTYVPSSTSTTSSYDPYKPATPQVQHQTNTYGYASSASPYDSYNSSAAGPQVPAPSFASSTTSSPYGPYRPNTSNMHSSPSLTTSGTSQLNSLASSTTLIPPPNPVDTSKPPPSPYRPSTLNAYDPPIPTVKPKKSMTASSLQYQSSPYSQQGITSPLPPPPSRSSTLSPPRGTSPLASGPPPPPRSTVHAPPKASAMTYASPPVGRSSSPYDPPISRPRDSPKPNAYRGPDHGGHPQVNGRYSPSVPISNTFDYARVGSPQTGYASPPLGGPQVGPNQYAPMQHHANNHESPPYGRFENTIPQSHAHQTQSFQNPETAPNGSARVDPGRSSRSISPESPSGTREYTQSPSEQTQRKSLESTSHHGGSQRAISPVSESGRSHTGSLGRGSPVNARTGPSFVGQSFSAIDEQAEQHTEPYNFMARSSTDRVGSPSARSVGSVGSYGGAVNPLSNNYSDQNQNAGNLTSNAGFNYAQTSPPTTQPSVSNIASNAAVYDPYKPSPPEHGTQRTSPETFVPSVPPPTNTYDPSNRYAPPPRSSLEARERSMSNISSFSSTSLTSYDPHAPSAQTMKQQDPSPYIGNTYGIPPAAPSLGSFANGTTRSSFEASYSPPPVTGPYAPSPSLLGLNDPLGRASAKVPVVSFGFGGKLVTCFHSPPILDTGFDVALSSRICTDVHIRILHKAIPEATLDVSSAMYPGPLFGDPGSPVSTLVRTATTTNAKNKSKKAKVLTYLDERAEEIQKGLGYLTDGSVDKRRADGKLALVRLLRVLVEHDGQLYGSSSAEAAVRVALLPRLADTQNITGSNAFLNAPTGAALATGAFGSAGTNERPLAEYVVRPSALETLQDFLLRGEKRKAYHYALDEKMWAHALVISSSVDKEAFKEVVSEFVRTELGVKTGSRPDAPVTNGYESLRLAYSLYSGQASTAVQHVLPTKSLQTGLAQPALTLQPPTPMNHMTPLSPNFPPPALATNIPPEILSQWQEYAVMLFSGQMGVESSTALTTLGDYLLSNDWVEAAHCCYLLSPQTSPIGGVGAPSVRVVLVGSHSPHRNALFSADPDSIIFSEILEYALSLHTPPKGQEPFAGFPHLQVYRLIRAVQLAEMGHTSLAKRYCDAITGAAFRPSPYLSQLFSDLLKELYGRLNGDPELEKANSWIAGKIAKPSLDGIGDWLGGRLSKFVAGEEPSSPSTGQHPIANDPAYSGTFSQFSNISSTNNSRRSSPAPSIINNVAPPNSFPGRAGSAAAIRSNYMYSPNGRASSSLDYERPDPRGNTPPPPRVLSADASISTFNQSQSFMQSMGVHAYSATSNGHQENGGASHTKGDNKVDDGGWWSSVYRGSSNETPTASSFSNVDAQDTGAESGGSGFISLMDGYNSFTPSPSVSTPANRKVEDADGFDEDDLGLGNSSHKKNKEKQAEDDGTEKKDEEKETKQEEVKKEELKKPDAKPNPSSSSSWFGLGRLFSRPSSTTPGPVKANLGEETSFYYDKELKRWVNKKAGAEPAKPAAPPPPPSRAQTASPSRSMQPSSTGPPPASPLPPPGRPMSASVTGSSSTPPPPKAGPMQRARSNLVPEDAEGALLSAPPTPTAIASLSAAPPTGRPKSAAKKNVRSRYVDVFQQPS